MLPDKDDAALLWDILNACHGIVNSMHGVTWERYRSDETLRLATERRIEIIGEAANHLSKSFREAHPEIPWRAMIAQRHVLAHEYGDVDDELIWTLTQEQVPGLIDKMQPLLPGPS